MKQDLKFAVRILLKHRFVTALSIVTLALGIGANTAIFSVMNAVVLRPLPYTNPDRLVTLWETGAGNEKRPVAPGNFVDWRAQNTTLSDVAATFYGTSILLEKANRNESMAPPLRQTSWPPSEFLLN